MLSSLLFGLCDFLGDVLHGVVEPLVEGDGAVLVLVHGVEVLLPLGNAVLGERMKVDAILFLISSNLNAF